MSGKHTPFRRALPPQQATEAPDALRDEVAHLHEAMKSQRDIGMAIGLLSATLRLQHRAGLAHDAARLAGQQHQGPHGGARPGRRSTTAPPTPEDHDVLETFVAQLPPSGWPGGPSA